MKTKPRKLVLALPPVPPALVRAKEGAEATRRRLHAARARREQVATPRHGTAVGPEKQAQQLAALDAEIAEAKASADEAGERHADLLDEFAAECRATVAPVLDDFEKRAATSLDELVDLLEQASRLRRAAQTVGVSFNSPALDTAPHLLRLLDGVRKLTSGWRR